MAKVTVDENKLLAGIDFAVLAGAQVLQAKMIEITPRDWKRPPQNIDRKDGKTPHRSRRRPPVSKDGHRYMGVSGHLRQSISTQKIQNGKYKVGIRLGYFDTARYGSYLEFGTVRMKPRSFIRQSFEDNIKLIQDVIKSAFNQYLNH